MALNPYSEWLGIPYHGKPPNCYELLGIPLFEADPAVIHVATEECLARVKRQVNWSNSAQAEQFYEELRAARILLLNPDTKAAYDMVLECDFSDSEAVLPADGRPGHDLARQTVDASVSDRPDQEPVPDPVPTCADQDRTPARRFAAAPAQQAPPQSGLRPMQPIPLPKIVLAEQASRSVSPIGTRAATAPVPSPNTAPMSTAPANAAPANALPAPIAANSAPGPAVPAVPSRRQFEAAPVTPGATAIPDAPATPATASLGGLLRRIVWRVVVPCVTIAASLGLGIVLVLRQLPPPAPADVASSGVTEPSAGLSVPMADLPPHIPPAEAAEMPDGPAPVDDLPEENSAPAPHPVAATPGRPVPEPVPDAGEPTADEPVTGERVAAAAAGGRPALPHAGRAPDAAPPDPVASEAKTTVPAAPSGNAGESPESGTDAPSAAPAAIQPSVPVARLPMPVPEFASATDKARYFEELRLLLEEGLSPQTDAIVVAKARFDAARRLCDTDPRLPYAYGLVALRHLKHDVAAEQFERASELSDFLYLPAWQARVWLHFQRKEFDSGLAVIMDMARGLVESQAAWPDEVERQGGAIWIGSAIGWLQDPAGESPRISQLATGRDAELRTLFRATHLEAYTEGKRQVSGLFAALLDWDEERQERDRQRREDAQDAAKSRIVADRERLRGKQEKLEMSADQWKSWINEQLTIFDAQLKALETEFNRFSKEGLALSSTIARLNVEINTLENQATTSRTIQQSNDYQREIGTRSSLRTMLLSQYEVVDRQAAATRKKAEPIVQQRAEAVNKFQAATGELIKENNSLGKWDKNLARKGKTTVRKPGSLAKADPKVRLLSSYLPFDFEQERQRVLDSFPAEAPSQGGP